MIKDIAKQYNIDYISLEDFSIASVAFTMENALKMVDAMEQEVEAILGGDIYIFDGKELEPAYMFWECERAEGMTLGQFVHSSCAYTKEYLSKIKKKITSDSSKQLLVDIVQYKI